MLARTEALAANRKRVRECRARQRRGVCLYAVEVNGAIIDMLVKLGWLLDQEATDKKLVSKALTAMLKDATRD
jgi:ribosomal protein S8